MAIEQNRLVALDKSDWELRPRVLDDELIGYMLSAWAVDMPPSDVLSGGRYRVWALVEKP